MILVRWLARTWSALSAPPPAPRPGPRARPSYARMGRYIAGGAALDPRVDLLVRQLAAELSGCRWCIEHGLHRWRKTFLPVAELRCHFSEQEVAALTQAVAGEHFFNPTTGALGADARVAMAGAAAGELVLGARRSAGSAMRN